VRVKLSDIPHGGLTVEGEISPGELDVHEKSFSIDKPVGVSLFVEIVDDVFVAKGSYRGSVNCTCDRCLCEFSRDPSNLSYLYAKELSALEGDTIDLTAVILEDILLGLPMKMLCSDGCKGLCPQCGANLNFEKCTCKPHPNISPFSELDKTV
jgi:uncharacterized protein